RWSGVRGLVFGEGGRVRLEPADVDVDGSADDLVPLFPDLRPLGRALGTREVVLDGVLTIPDESGRHDPERLRERLDAAGSSDSVVRRLSRQHPAVYLAFDV